MYRETVVEHIGLQIEVGSTELLDCLQLPVKNISKLRLCFDDSQFAGYMITH